MAEQNSPSANRGDGYPKNVGETERWLSMFGAGVFVTCGMMRASLPLLALGGALAYRGYSGHCHVYKALGYDTSDSEADSSAQENSRLVLSS